MKFLRFKTALFFVDQPDDQLDKWFVGGDCAAWVYMRLMPIRDVKYFCDPTMEDWGWTMAVKHGGIEVWFLIYYDSEQWVIGFETRKSLFQKSYKELRAEALREIQSAVEKILIADCRFTEIDWSETPPFESVCHNQS